MESNEIKLRMTVNLDGYWSTLMGEEELTEYLTSKLNSCIGFRGRVKKLKLVKPGEKKEDDVHAITQSPTSRSPR